LFPNLASEDLDHKQEHRQMSPINDDQILSAIRAELDHLKVEGGFEAGPQTTWVGLNLDSLDLVELVKALEDRFDVQFPECAVKSVVSVGDVLFVVRSQRAAAVAA
jgi:acyl carrier protein